MSLTESLSESLTEYLIQFPQAKRIELVGPFTEDKVSSAGPILFVDGGAHHQPEGLGFSVGDADSHPGPHNIQLPKEKDASDLAHTLGLIPSQFEEVHLRGFLGGRRDHEMINFGEVQSFLEARIFPTKVTFDESVMAYSAGEWCEDFKGLFSVFVFRPIKLQLNGQLQYRYLKSELFPAHSSLGLSNQAYGQITLECSGPAFLFIDR